MKRTTRRLSINRTTLRILTAARMGAARGGMLKNDTEAGSCDSGCTSCWNSETGVCVTNVSCPRTNCC